MRKKIIPLVFLSLLILSAGCDRPGDSYFPLDVGLWRYYETETQVLDEAKRQRLIAGIAEISKAGADGPYYVHRQAPDQDTYIAISAGNFMRFARRDRSTLVETWFPTPLKIMPVNPKLGDSWTIESELALVESRTFARQDKLRNRTIQVALTVQVTTFDDIVEVPAGRYENCLKLSGKGIVKVRTDRGNASAEVVVSQLDWYAKGIGLIKSVRTETSDSPFLKKGSFTQEMIALGRD